MCGIAGILDYSNSIDLYREVVAMTESLKHRGPDDSGVFSNKKVAIGHTRLAIIDPHGGKQPLFSPNGEAAITYNGEIYNYKELRSDLETQGFSFKTKSDTEVVLTCYLRYGITCTEKFNGMYSFCVVDFNQRKLFLARDHAGIKPLYYWKDKRFFAFASELCALRAIKSATPTGSLQSIDYYLRYQYIPSPDTIYHEIKKLPPAHRIEIPFEGEPNPINRFWGLKFDEKSESRSQEHLEDILEKAIKRSMTSDVPVGVFLSGGIDSSLVALKAAQTGENILNAFSIGFTLQQYSELDYAKQAANRLGLKFHAETLDQSALDILPSLIQKLGEPFGDFSIIPTWHVSKLARNHVKTVLSGDGGDEAFAGYHRYFSWFSDGKFSRPKRKELFRDIIAGRIKNMREAFNLLGAGPEAWCRFIYITRYPERIRLWQKPLRFLSDTPSLLFQQAYLHAKGRGCLAHAQSIDFETYLPGDILFKVDTASMMHGLEVRPSLLDKELLEVAATLRPKDKYRGGKTGKIALQKLLFSHFPQEFIQRSKRGFLMPCNEWMSPGNKGYQMLKELLSNNNNQLFDWFVKDEINNHIKIQESGRNNSHQLWLLLILALWTENNKEISFSIA